MKAWTKWTNPILGVVLVLMMVLILGGIPCRAELSNSDVVQSDDTGIKIGKFSQGQKANLIEIHEIEFTGDTEQTAISNIPTGGNYRVLTGWKSRNDVLTPVEAHDLAFTGDLSATVAVTTTDTFYAALAWKSVTSTRLTPVEAHVLTFTSPTLTATATSAVTGTWYAGTAWETLTVGTPGAVKVGISGGTLTATAAGQCSGTYSVVLFKALTAAPDVTVAISGSTLTATVDQSTTGTLSVTLLRDQQPDTVVDVSTRTLTVSTGLPTTGTADVAIVGVPDE